MAETVDGLQLRRSLVGGKTERYRLRGTERGAERGTQKSPGPARDQGSELLVTPVPSFLSWKNSFHFKVLGRRLALV
jgi:hypothetical protein